MADQQQRHEHHMQLYRVIIGLATFAVLITTTTTLLRVYCRAKVLKSFTLEDWAMCFAWSGSVVFASLGLLSLRYSPTYGHASTKHNLQKTGQIIWGVEIIAGPTLAATKLSIILQLMRVFTPIPGSARRRALLILLCLNMGYFIGVFFVSIFQCSPSEKLWIPTVKGHCINQPVYTLIGGIFNFTSDCLMLLTPIIFIWKLRLSWNRKFGAVVVFLIGILACATSILRVIYSIPRIKDSESYNVLVTVALCIYAEVCAGILCGNLPNMPALARYLRQKPNTPSNSVPEHNGFSLKDVGSLLRSTSGDASIIRDMDSARSKDNAIIITRDVQLHSIV